MINEIIFFTTIFLDVAFMLLMLRVGGRSALYGVIIVNLIMVSIFGSKIVATFGFVSNSTNVFYACVFLATNIIVELYGRKNALRGLLIGFCALLVFVIMNQFVLRYLPIEGQEPLQEAFMTIFKQTPRIAFASLVAFVVSMSVDIYIFDYLKRRAKVGNLWIRNILACAIGQGVDSVLFFGIAFYMVIKFDLLLQIILIGFIIKLFVAVISTPFLYLSYSLKSDE